MARSGSLTRYVVGLGVLAGLGIVACGSDGATPTSGDAGLQSAPLTCGATETKCGQSCVDTASNRENCGACGTACNPSEVCSSGACALACAPGQTKCGSDNATCVDTNKDPANCGGCGNACAAGLVCAAGTCALSCSGSTTKCGQSCVDTKIDEANCGACGAVCGAGTTCRNGGCCAGNLTSCSASCVDIKRAKTDCGACGTACGGGQSCIAGTCKTTPTSCAAIKAGNASAPDGIYEISVNSVAVNVWCDMTTDGGGWTMVHKLNRGAGGDANTIWNGGPLNETDDAYLAPATRNAGGHYVSSILGQWNTTFTVTSARVHVYDGGALAAFLKFDVLGASTMTDWYAKANLVDSTWTDLAAATPNYFSIAGDPSVGRRWYVNNFYGGCGVDSGWIVADSPGDPCAWEFAGTPPRILYATGTAYKNWQTGVTSSPSTVNLGDTLAVYVR